MMYFNKLLKTLAPLFPRLTVISPFASKAEACLRHNSWMLSTSKAVRRKTCKKLIKLTYASVKISFPFVVCNEIKKKNQFLWQWNKCHIVTFFKIIISLISILEHWTWAVLMLCREWGRSGTGGDKAQVANTNNLINWCSESKVPRPGTKCKDQATKILPVCIFNV